MIGSKKKKMKKKLRDQNHLHTHLMLAVRSPRPKMATVTVKVMQKFRLLRRRYTFRVYDGACEDWRAGRGQRWLY